MKSFTVNKKTKWQRKSCGLSVSWYFETFQSFTKFFFGHKWNDIGLLPINKVNASSFTSCQTTDNLGSYEIKKSHETV